MNAHGVFRWFGMIGLTFNGILFVAASSHAGIPTVSWTLAIANTDGSPVTDLALFRVYYRMFDSPCPGSSFVEVASPSLIPPANGKISFQLTGLTAGASYGVSVTAVNTQGNKNLCSVIASAIAQDDPATPPISTTGPRPGPVTTPPIGTGIPRQ